MCLRRASRRGDRFRSENSYALVGTGGRRRVRGCHDRGGQFRLRHPPAHQHGQQPGRGLHLVGRRRREGRSRRPGQHLRHRLPAETVRQRRRSPVAPAPTPSRSSPRGCSRATRRTPSRPTPGAELTDYINAGQVEDLSPEYKEWGLDRRVPEGSDRQPHGQRQDLLSAGQHPPRERAVEQQDGARRRRHHTRTPRPWTRFFADLDKLKAKGVDAAGHWARTGPRRCCSRRS